MSAIPNGNFTPLKAKIAPTANNAVLTIPVTAPIGPRNAFIIAFQFNATAPPRFNAPVAIKAIPNGNFTPLKANIAPTTRSAVPTIAIIALITVCTSLDNAFQLGAITVAAINTPPAINAIPKGIFVPLKANIAPTTNNASVTMVSITAITPLISSLNAFVFIAICDASDTAPIAIRAIPKGTLIPVNAKIAPTANGIPPTIAAISL